MGLLKEFKTFAMRGNVIDMAVGIVIGGAFGKIVTSLVNDVIMPPIGILLGKVDFSQMAVVLKKEVVDEAGKVITPATTLGYGMFINTIINFIIVAFAIFMVIKAMNAAKKKEEAAPAAPPAPTKDQMLLTEIRDALKSR